MYADTFGMLHMVKRRKIMSRFWFLPEVLMADLNDRLTDLGVSKEDQIVLLGYTINPNCCRLCCNDLSTVTLTARRAVDRIIPSSRGGRVFIDYPLWPLYTRNIQSKYDLRREWSLVAAGYYMSQIREGGQDLHLTIVASQ